MTCKEKLLFVFIFIPFFLFAQTPLTKKDVRETFEEMLKIHVEHEKMQPLLLSRAIKNFLEQFDVSKTYLLDAEVKKFFHRAQQVLEKSIQSYEEDQLVDFVKANRLIQKSIQRARKWRQEFQKEYILSTQGVVFDGGETYLNFGSSEEALKHRIQQQLIQILTEEKEANQLADWTPKDREKIFVLWEKRLQRKEERYQNAEPHLVVNCLKALAKSLDAHSAYFSPEEALDMRVALEKQFEGVGVVLREGLEGIVIADLIKGGPADKQGTILKGDYLVAIDGKSLEQLSYPEILQAMKGTGSKELCLKLFNKTSQSSYEVVLQREKIMLNEERLQYSLQPSANGNIGIIYLPSFYEGAGQSAEKDLKEAIHALKKQGDLAGLILDMRENSGGFLGQAVKIAGLFISKGVMVISKYCRGEIKYLRNLEGKIEFDGPLLVLTSRASASAAEIVAAALQDYGAALIVGDQQTYGKGTIQYQTVTNQEAKNFYKVTIGKYYRVSGRSTQIVGVKADILIPTTFAPYRIGEQFLEYPLQNDEVEAAYLDPLTDIDARSRAWFQKHYLPHLHQPQQRWQKMLPQLQENSRVRLENNKNFALFLKMQSEGNKRREEPYPWGEQDLPMEEAVNVLQDMLSYQKQAI